MWSIMNSLMFGLVFAIVVMLLLSAGMFWAGARTVRKMKPWPARLLALGACTFILIYVYAFLDRPVLTWILPVVDVVVWGNWMLLFVGFLCGIAHRRP